MAKPCTSKNPRMRNIFEKTLEGFECDVSMFVPVGKKGEKYKILLDHSCIRWEPTMISIFNTTLLKTKNVIILMIVIIKS